MTDEGPPIEALTRRLAECPPEFLAAPRVGGIGAVHVDALISDLTRDLGSAIGAKQAARFRGVGPDRAWLEVVLVASWLLHDSWFRERRRFAAQAYVFLAEGLAALARLVPAGRLVSDPERREELARLALRALGLRPAGETAAQAEDRLTTLSSVERQRVVREARAVEERARQIREAMARKAAEEAAARYSPE